MKLLKIALITLVLTITGAALASTNSYALDPLGDVCAQNPQSEICASQDDNSDSFIKTIVNTLLFVAGSLSVIMIIVGGIFYVISNGDPNKMTRAKNTVIYSAAGLVISLVAYAIVNWVLGTFTS